ncbi:MAG: hypothetical protein JST20_13650 [Bacteroidetes bacterium]|nr:hypothetical protein [Bacteroidota bacterium]
MWRYQVLNGNKIGDTLDVSISATQIFNSKMYFVMVTSTKNGKYASEYCRIENDKLYKFQDNKEILYIDFGKKDSTVGYVYETIDGVESSVGTFDKVKNVSWIAAMGRSSL